MKHKSLALFLSVLLVLTCIPASIQNTLARDADTPVAAAAGEFFKEVYEAEDATLIGAAAASVLDDYSGLGYVDGLPKNASITFSVDVDATMEYGVRLRYVNGTSATRTVGVYVNGTKVRDSQLAQTINNTTWRVQLENLVLQAGGNTITYVNESVNDCEDVRFDKISLSWMYEAESSTYVTRLGGIGLDTDSHAGRSGQDMAFPSTGSGQGLRFTVNVPVAGEYAMVIRYGAGHTNQDARSLSLYTNGAKIKQLQFASTRTWPNWSDFVWNINLNAGENTISIQRDSGDNSQVNVDYITLKPVQWTYAGEITSIIGNNSSELTFMLDNSVVRVKSVDKNAVKVWLEPLGKFTRRYESFTVVNEAVAPENLSAVDKDIYFEIDAGNILMRIQKNPFKITYLDKTGKILCENENQSMGWTTDGELTVRSKLQADEQFWGLGEKLASFNRRGTNLTMWSHDCYGNILNSSVPTNLSEGRYYFSNPYFVSSKGYSILFDNSSRTVFDLGQSSNSTYSFGTYNPNPGNELVYYFIYGPEIKQITKTFTDIIGKTFFAPEWAYGNIQCHYGYRQTDVENVAQTYRDKNIPIDMMMADIEWYDTQCTPTAWHRTMFPDPDSMLAKLKNLNIRMGLIDDPNVSAVVRSNQTPPDYVEGNANGYFVKDHSNQTKVITWPWGQSFGQRGSGDSGLTDFFNPDARKWWGDLHNMILNQGVEAFWLDMNEPAKYHMDWLFWNQPGKAYGTISEVKNAFAIKHHQAMYEKLHENGKRSLLLSRSGYTGSQRYVSPWTGDVNGDYTSLAQQINLGISLSMTGYNYWGFDIGGFFTTIDNKLYKRWIELACFTPIHRFHYCDGVEAKEPWTHQSEDVSRFYINLRYMLKPYMYSLAADNILGIGIEKGVGSGGTGIPYVRPMVMEYPNDTNTYSMDTQFMAGPSFLVAPVVANSDMKQVYLPEGYWYDYFNEPLIFSGGRTITVDAPEEVLPLFVKEGSIIPMYPLMQYWGEKPVDLLTLDVYPTISDGEFSFVQYEDDGETEEYIEKGIYTTTDYNCLTNYEGKNVSYRLDIGTRKGTYTDIAPRDYMLQFHGGYLKNASVKLDAAALAAKLSMEELNASDSGYYIDPGKEICYVKIKDTGLAATVTVNGDQIDRSSLEFEDGLITGNAAVANTAGGFSGDGYVTGLTTAADTATVTFTSETAGLYPVYIRYSSDKYVDMTVSTPNESQTVEFSATNTGSWKEIVVLINMKRGGNYVKISGTGASGGVLIDCLRVPDELYWDFSDLAAGAVIGSNIDKKNISGEEEPNGNRAFTALENSGPTRTGTEGANQIVANNGSSKFCGNVTSSTAWFILDAGEQVKMPGYIIRGANDDMSYTVRVLDSWIVQGSNSASGPWTTISSPSGQGLGWTANYQTRMWLFDRGAIPDEGFRYYRLQVTRGGYNGSNIGNSNYMIQFSYFGLVTAYTENGAFTAQAADGVTEKTDTVIISSLNGPNIITISGDIASTVSAPVAAKNYHSVKTGLNLKVNPDTKLGYTFNPKNNISANMAIDVRFSDGTRLSELNAIDQYGIGVNPIDQGKGSILRIGQWNYVETELGKVAEGKVVNELIIGFEVEDAAPGQTVEGFFDNIMIFGGERDLQDVNVITAVYTAEGKLLRSSVSDSGAALAFGAVIFNPELIIDANGAGEGWYARVFVWTADRFVPLTKPIEFRAEP